MRLSGVAMPALASRSAMVAEEARRHRQVEGADVVGLLVELLGERRPAVVAGGVDRHVVDRVQELVDQRRRRAGAGSTNSSSAPRTCLRKSARLILVRAAPMTRAPGGHLVHRQPAVEARQDLAVREIAGGAEDHQVERLDGNDGRDHGGRPFNAMSSASARQVGAAPRAGDRRGAGGVVEHAAQRARRPARRAPPRGPPGRRAAARSAPPERCRRRRRCRSPSTFGGCASALSAAGASSRAPPRRRR